jgi:AsmA protein
MATWAKPLAVIFFALLLLVLGAAATLPWLMDREQLRIDLQAGISESLARRTTIEGIGDLRLLPTPSVRLDGVRVDAGFMQAGGPAPEALATIEQLELRAALWPLILGRLRLVDVIITRPVVALSVLAREPLASGSMSAGHGRWAYHLTSAEAAVPGATGQTDGVDSAVVAAAGIQPIEVPPIERFMVRDGTLTQRLSGNAGNVQIRALELTASPLIVGRAGRLDAAFEVQVPWSASAFPGRLEAQLELEEPLTQVSLRPLRLEIGAGTDAAEPLVDAAAEAVIELATGRAAIDSLRVGMGSLRILGSGVLSPHPEGLGADAHVRIPPLDLRAWISERTGVPLPGSALSLSRVAADFNVRLAGYALAIDNAELALDATGASAWARLDLPRTPGALATGQVALALDRLDAGLYLPLPATAGFAPPGTAVEPGVRPLLPPVVDAPVVDALSLMLSATELGLGGLRLGALELEALIGADWLDAGASADLYGGAVEASYSARRALAGISAAGQPHPGGEVEMSLDGLARGVDLDPMLGDLGHAVGATAALSGIADLECALQARAGGSNPLLQTLGGDVDLLIRDGAITAVDLGQRLGAALRMMGAGPDDVAELTRFSTLSLHASGAAGQFRSEDILLRSAMLQVDGAGQVDLPTQQMALDLHAVVADSAGNRGIKELKDIPIPITASGPWAAPRWNLDLKAALDVAAKRALNKEGGLLDKLDERTGIKGLGEGLRQILPGLLGR